MNPQDWNGGDKWRDGKKPTLFRSFCWKRIEESLKNESRGRLSVLLFCNFPVWNRLWPPSWEKKVSRENHWSFRRASMVLAEEGEERQETTQFCLRRDNLATTIWARISSTGNLKQGDRTETLGAASTKWLPSCTGSIRTSVKPRTVSAGYGTERANVNRHWDN